MDDSKTLKLHFCDKKAVQPCLGEMKEHSPVQFTWEEDAVDMADVLTKPEARDCTAAALLTFQSDQDAQTFMCNPNMTRIFRSYSSQGKEPKRPEPIPEEPQDE